MGGLLAQVEADVAELVAGPLWTLSDAEITDGVRRVHAVIQQLSGRLLTLIGTADSREIPYTAGATGTANWLTYLLAMRHRDAVGWTKLAKLLPETPVVEQALAAGQVAVEQARVIAKTVHDLPSAVGDAGKAKAADVLTKLAVDDLLRPETLENHRSQILELVAPEIAEERLRKDLERAERSAYDRRDFTLIPHGEGEYRVRGVLDAEMAAIVRTALDPLSAPRKPTPTATAAAGHAGAPDAAGGSHASGGTDVDAGRFTMAGGAGTGCVGVDATGGFTVAGCTDAGCTDACADASGAGAGRGADAADVGRGAARVLPGEPDLRSAGARRADALVEVCQRIMNAGELPDNGGEKPHLTITLPWDALQAKVGAGLLDTGDLLTPETVRRLACDAKIIPAVLGGDGQVLDVGRARRLIDGPLRRALVLRDKGCAFPGCDRPPQWCHGHHIRSWADGGDTCLTNSVLLCGFHHREIHHGHWEVRIRPDGFPEFLPPAFVDPRRGAVRNTLHRRC
ncbi:hypothetical protein HDA40_000518 [Hamadaea flava]|uniref:DUF222 domain-containing protein n=1 Tax=Hamadaea flava TaxID=1742688 RepID=A0ABV8M2J4_9ACTN|nr:HNH endonuclease signature motif containing protein [Hamadaea flava]MCP2322011.1 hypothetical protein [Hamadaea flava]